MKLQQRQQNLPKTGTAVLTLAMLALIVIVGSYIRLAHLGGPSFWVDEMNHVTAARSLLDGKGAVLLSQIPYTRSILFTHLVSYSISFFTTDEFAARLPSALFGILTIVLIFYIGWRMFGRRIHGLVAALLYASNPFMIGWARECRMYSMFQFLFILGVYAIYEGFEGTRIKPGASIASQSTIKSLSRQWNLDFPWIIVTMVALFMATSLQILASVLLPAIVVYLTTMVLFLWIFSGWKQMIYSKYVYFLMAIFVMLAAGSVLLPGFWQEARSTMAFAPNWARHEYVQNPLYYYYFVTSSFYFSIAVFFLVGAGFIIARWHRSGYYLLLNFLVPVALLSFLFVVRVERYIYHLYPLLLLVVSYGVVDLGSILKKNFHQRLLAKLGDRWQLASTVVAYAFVVAFLLAILGMSDWFRFSRKIPSLQYGTNCAVEHLEWREGIDFMKPKLTREAPIISTLPLTVHYYAGRAEYFLASLQNPRPDEVYISPTGKRDTYSNALVIDTVDDLKNIMASSARGWLVVDRFRFEQARFVRPEVMNYIKMNLKLAYLTPGGTIEVYVWE